MAAYAALVSLMYIIKQIQHHPRPPISLDEHQVQSLTEKVTFLQEFLEVHSHVRNEEADRLQIRIAEAAYVAEDVIESHIVDRILDQSASHGKMISSVEFYQDLQKVIQDMDLVEKEVLEIKEKMGSLEDIRQQTRSSMPAARSLRSPTEGKNTIVGFDHILNQLMDKLTRQKSSRQIIPIVGMGGIGKTTLARNVNEHKVIVEHFDIRAWATISQEFNAKEVLLELLCPKKQDNRESLSQLTEKELGGILYKRLWNRRYLIIMDDMWSIKVWDKMKFFFPDNNNGSGIIITTRLSNVALHFTRHHSDHGLEMSFLNNESGWSLLCKIVFGENDCPLELEEIGRKIAENCKGLPLSIVVIGGHLAKSQKSPEYWEYIAQNLNSIINSEDNEHCFNVLRMSYDYLPVHLKPCFLYMGVFDEDSDIYADEIIKSWVAEGFLKPINRKTLEEVAEEYLKDLIDRNLILAKERGYHGKIETCMIHDVLRELCLREGEKDKFLLVARSHSLNNFVQGINTQRRVVIRGSTSQEEDEYYLPQIREALQSATLVRTLMCDTPKFLPSPSCRLLRILLVVDKDSESSQRKYSGEAFISQLVNLRYILAFSSSWKPIESQFPFSDSLFWNLQVLLSNMDIKSIDIWKMPLLRHVYVPQWYVPDLGWDDIVLGNLQCLEGVRDFRCSKEMVKRIPNIKTLRVAYGEGFMVSHHCLNNLTFLHKLEHFGFSYDGPRNMLSRIDLVENLMFMHFLKELTLRGCDFHWEDISTKIGSLRHLEALTLLRSCLGPKWVTTEGQFCSLKSLTIFGCDLECWTTENTHFPCLNLLYLHSMHKLKEIPLDIGDIPTLQSIELYDCSFSSIVSAKKIVEEQEENGNEDLQVQVTLLEKNEEVENWAKHNFLVEVR